MEPLIPAIVAAVVVVLIVLYLARTTRRLKRMRNELEKDWSDIEFLFKQRQDELPRLIQTSRSYMPEEKRVLDSVSAARSRYQRATTGEQKAGANRSIDESLQELFVAAGKHPDLERNNTFVQLQTRISEIEERISERRELYESDVKHFNRRITHFPGSIPARLAGLKPRTEPNSETRDERRETR